MQNTHLSLEPLALATDGATIAVHAGRHDYPTGPAGNACTRIAGCILAAR